MLLLSWRFMVVYFFLIFKNQMAFAHLKWVVDSKDIVYLTEGRFVWDVTNNVILIGACFFVLFAWFAHSYLCRKKVFNISVGSSLQVEKFFSLVSLFVGVMLIFNSIESTFLAPEVQLSSNAQPHYFIVIQALVGIFLISNLSLFYSGLLLLLGLLGIGIVLPFIMYIDYLFEFAFLGVAFLIVGSGAHRKPNDTDDTSLFLLRNGVGLSLIVLGIHNKLLSPELGLAFLSMHDFNFIHTLGFEFFSNLDFVFLIGVSEVLLGVMLCFGVFVKMISLILLITMVLTAALLGVAELFGHLPLMGAALTMMIFGGGRVVYFHKVHHYFYGFRDQIISKKLT